MADIDDKDKGIKPDDKGNIPGATDDKGQKTDTALEQFVGKLDKALEGLSSTSDRLGAIEQTVNLLQANAFSPEGLDTGKGKKSSTPVDKGTEPKSFDQIDWDRMDNRELAITLVTELNNVLKENSNAANKSSKAINEQLESLTTELDIVNTISKIAEDDDCSIRVAVKKFWSFEKEMTELSNKYPEMGALDAYKIASGAAGKPKDGDEKGKGDDKGALAKKIADELRGGGGKPGGATDLDTKASTGTRETVSKRFDEIFPDGVK